MREGPGGVRTGPQWELDRKVARRLKDHRKRAGMSQRQLGEGMVGRGFPTWCSTTVSKAEHGERRFTAAEIPALADALGIDSGELLPGVEMAGPMDPRARVEISERLGEQAPFWGVDA